MKYVPVKHIALLASLLFIGVSCKSRQGISKASENKAPVVLSDKETELFEKLDNSEETEIQMETDSTEYDIIIMDIGFNAWLQGIAWPKGYYSQSFMEQRNYIYVTEWNQRVLQPNLFPPLLYELQINYDPQIDYGYDVNYQLYNYFIYFQRRYNQRLGPFLPRI